MKKIKIALYIISILAIGYFLYLFRDDLYMLKNIQVLEIIVLVALVSLMMFIQAIQFLGITKFFNKKIPILDMFAITSISTMYNYILPASGGMAIRGVLLKKKFNISWGAVAAVMGAYHIACYVGMTILLLVTATLVYSMGYLSNEIYIVVLSFFALLAIGVVVVYKLNLRFPPKNKLLTFLNQMIEGVHQLKKEYKRHYRTIAYQIIVVLISSIKLYLCFEFLEIPVSSWKIFLVQSFIVLSLVFSLTPGNIGIQEGILIAFSGFLDLPPESLLIGGILDRVTNVIAVLLLGISGKVWLLKQVK